MRAARFLLAAAACALAAAAAHADTTPLASVHLMEHPAKAAPPGLPASGPKVVLYFKDGASAPGCGLLPHGGTQIAPLLEPDQGEDFPQCTGVPAAATFPWRGRTVYVLRYLQRDTREDTSENDAALIDGPDGLAPVEGIDDSLMPKKKSVASVAAWVKAQLVGMEDAKAGFKPSPGDAVGSDNAYLAVARDAAGGRCRLTAGALAGDEAPAPVLVPCAGLIATTGFANGKTSWFVAMLQGADHKPAVRVFSSDGQSAHEAPELETKVAATAAGGKILPVRDALRKLVAAR